MKPPRKVRAQRKFAQGAYAPAATSIAVYEKKLAELRKDTNKSVIRNHVAASVLLDIVSFKNIHRHLQPVVIVERLKNTTIQKDNTEKKNKDATQDKKITEKVIKKNKVVRRVPHSWDMTLRSRSTPKTKPKMIQKQVPKKQGICKSKRNENKTCQLEGQKTKRRRLISKEFTSDDNKPLTYFVKTTVETNANEAVTAINKKRTNNKHFRNKNTQKRKAVTNMDIKHNKKATAALHNDIVQDSQKKDISPQIVTDDPAPIPSTAEYTLVEYGCQSQGAVDEPQPGPSGLQGELDNCARFTPDSIESMKDFAIPTILASSAFMDSSSSIVTDSDAIIDVVTPLTCDNNMLEETSKSLIPDPSLTMASAELLITSSASPIAVHDTIVNNSTHLNSEIADPVSVNHTGATPMTDDVTATSTFIALQPSELQMYLEGSLPAPYYNERAIQHWIAYSTPTSDSPRPEAVDAAPSAGSASSVTSTQTSLAICPTTMWATFKDVMNAPTQDLEARCKKCATCQKIAKLFMLSKLLKKHRRIECTGGEEAGDGPDPAAPRDHNTVSSDGDLYMELLPRHPHFMIKLKIQVVHNKHILSARLIPRADARKNNELNVVEHQSIVDQVIKMLTYDLVEPTSICSTFDPMDNISRPGCASVKEESVVDLTLPDSKCSVRSEGRSDAGSQHSSFPKSVDRAKLVDAPVFYPTQEEFADPIAYFEKIAPIASKYGLCKVIPPPAHRFTPKCKIDDEIRFDVINQYISRLYNRWGPAARELCAIKACLKSQSLNLTRSPLLDGIEVNLPKLYHVVQRNGGLEKVIDKKRWGRVAEEMSFTKTPNPERKLDNIYVKYLLPYDTLAHKERQEIIRKVEKHWNIRNQKMLDRALNPLHRQKRLLGESESSDEDTGDESDVGNALAEAEDCIVPGSCMNLSKFKRVAAIALENNFRTNTEPSPEVVEELYWRLVLLGTEHVCVNTASIDTGEEGYGFSKNLQDPYAKHPWNLKMLSQNSRNVLRSLGPVLGLTVPSLHLGMVFSTSCWHSDPHGLPWIEYMHQGSPKIWYGIPNEQSQNFRKAVETLCPTSCQNKSIWLPSDITMIPPTLLLEHNVSLSKVAQNPGEFIMVYPEAYSCSISTGYTLTESVYFATHSWLNSVHLVFQELRESCEPTMFSIEQLLLAVVQDLRTPPDVLRQAHATLAAILAEELRRREQLHEFQIPFILDRDREHVTNKKRRNTSAWNVRDLDECEVCRMTLYLSKVSGLTGKKSSVCLQHALQLLNAGKVNELNVAACQLVVYIPNEELELVIQ